MIVQCSGVEDRTIQYSAMQCDGGQCSAVHVSNTYACPNVAHDVGVLQVLHQLDLSSQVLYLVRLTHHVETLHCEQLAL